MVESSIQQFSGQLSPAQAAEGINAACRNARRLLGDARILLEANRFPTAASLAALSIEESGKVPIIRGILLTAERGGLKAEWRRYRDHRSKNGAWILPDLVARGARRLADLKATIERDGEHTSALNGVKQLGLYTDCVGSKGNWSEPDVVVDAAVAQTLVRRAEILAAARDVTVREMELWMEHLGPVWQTLEMPHGLLRWAEALHREGLSDRRAEEYARFVLGELEAKECASRDSGTH